MEAQILTFFYPTYSDIDFDTFNYGDEWKEFYGDVTKAIPINALDPRGNSFDLRMWVDSDHAGAKRQDDRAQGISYS